MRGWFEARRMFLLKDLEWQGKIESFPQRIITFLFYTSPGVLNENTRNLNRDVRLHADRNSRFLYNSSKCLLEYTSSNARRVRFLVSQNILFSDS
jgi:hypothetical protein